MSKIYLYQYEDWFDFAWDCEAQEIDMTKHKYAWCDIRNCNCKQNMCPRIKEFEKGIWVDESKLN